MKKYILSMIVAVFAFIAILPIQASAAEEESAGVDCAANEDKTVSVYLKLPNASKEEIATFQLKLEVNLGSTGDSAELTLPSMDFSEAVKSRAKVYESRYTDGALNVYVSGTESVFGENDILEVGTVAVRDAQGDPVDIQVSLAGEDAFKVVRGGAEVIPELEEWSYKGSEGSEDPGTEPPGSNDPNNPDNPNDPSGDIEEPPVVSDIVDTAKDQYYQNRKLNGTRVQGVSTGDTNPVILCVAVIAISLIVIAAVVYRRRRLRRV